MRPKIEYSGHRDTMKEAAHFFPGLTVDNMPGGEGFAAAENITLSTHNGTHLDAPWHFHSTMDGGAGKDVDDHRRGAARLVFPARREARFPSPARRSRGDGRGREAELAASAMRCSRSTSSSSTPPPAGAYGTPGLRRHRLRHGPGSDAVPPQRGVRVTGTDAWSWDAPFAHTAKKVRRDRRCLARVGRPQGGPRHRLLPPREAAQPRGAAAARVHDQLLSPQDRGASAGWTRAVAIIEEA